MNFSVVPSGQVTPSQTGHSTAIVAVSAPDGRSPNGKRPRQVEEGQATARAPMSTAELTTVVGEIQPLIRNTAEAVQWNCDLLNALIGRVNTIEAWTKIAEPEIAAAKAATIDDGIRAKVIEMIQLVHDFNATKSTLPNCLH